VVIENAVTSIFYLIDSSEKNQTGTSPVKSSKMNIAYKKYSFPTSMLISGLKRYPR
jgi:hypothetical protein